MAGSVGGLALLLAALGVGGAFGYAVRQQKRQIAVRLALGARTRDVIASVLESGARPLVIGLIVGFVGAFICGQLFRGSLHGLNPLDPVSYVYVVILIAGAAIAALAIPTWRASRVDPVSVLRTD
jgi:ABC-type antimicrobial peptide transport system permease subunit